MRVLICGGRDFADVTKKGHIDEWKFMLDWLDKRFADTKPSLIIHGAAKGADCTAHVWANYAGVSVKQFPADWERYGKRAGYVRNKIMLVEGVPDLVIAFPGGKGTAMMVKIAKEAEVPVEEVKYEI